MSTLSDLLEMQGAGRRRRRKRTTKSRTTKAKKIAALVRALGLKKRRTRRRRGRGLVGGCDMGSGLDVPQGAYNYYLGQALRGRGGAKGNRSSAFPGCEEVLYDNDGLPYCNIPSSRIGQRNKAKKAIETLLNFDLDVAKQKKRKETRTTGISKIADALKLQKDFASLFAQYKNDDPDEILNDLAARYVGLTPRILKKNLAEAKSSLGST